MKRLNFKIACFVAMLLATVAVSEYAVAENKNWSGEGDGADWFDGANWMPVGTPAAADDAKVDKLSAETDVGQTFDAKSLTIGGKKASTVNVGNFVSGKIAPADPANEAMTVRRDGKVVLKGSAGKVTLQGSYKDSEEVIPDEPSFMVYVQ